MEQVTHVFVSERECTIIVCGNRGSQRQLNFAPNQFYNALNYLKSRMLPQHILQFY